MGLPRLYSLQNGRSILTAFGGLNESYACGEAEFTEEMNFPARAIRHYRPGTRGGSWGRWPTATECTT